MIEHFTDSYPCIHHPYQFVLPTRVEFIPSSHLTVAIQNFSPTEESIFSNVLPLLLLISLEVPRRLVCQICSPEKVALKCCQMELLLVKGICAQR